jgi:hypothetical protein
MSRERATGTIDELLGKAPAVIAAARDETKGVPTHKLRSSTDSDWRC